MAKILTPIICLIFMIYLLSIASCSEVMDKYQIDEAIKQCKDHGGMKTVKTHALDSSTVISMCGDGVIIYSFNIKK